MTDFNTFLNQGWSDHAAEPAAVFARCQDATDLVEEPGQLAALGILAAHVSGEHLGRWDEGAAFLDSLRGHASYRSDEPSGRQLHLSKASLHLASGDGHAAERELAAVASPEHHPASPRVRMLAATSAALAGRGRTAQAMTLFEEALALAAYDPPASDPAARALAVTGNNLAVELEQAPDRDAAGTRLMKTAAATARRYWERVGTWVNVKIAEVRLAHTHLAAGEADLALARARAALSLCDEQDAPDAHRFYPWVAESLALHALGERAAALLASGRAERALATMDSDQWPGADADYESLRNTLAADSGAEHLR
ncbi:MAG: hypothetical protein F4X99_17145 [Gammaproteobacteria bacterium]|nr:hypothetical protein [Gammaproteobacteria bacterium]